ncbi:MAG: potassium channel protein [Cyclobacteriaceae bacterium]
MFRKIVKNKRYRLFLLAFLAILTYNLLIVALVESEKLSRQSALTTYENAYWYSIVTLTTVGYGDLFPATTYGRIIGGSMVLLSMVFYAIIIGGMSTIITNLKESRKLGYNGTNYKNHAVIIGWNDFGSMVTDQLLGVNKDVAIVTSNKDDIDSIKDKFPSKKIFTLFSDFKSYEILQKANIESSSIVFVNLPDDTEKLVYILNLRKIYPDLEFVVTLENIDLKNTFISAGVTNCISIHEISSKLLASYLFEPDVAEYSESIMSFAKADSDYDIKQFLVTQSNPYIGKLYQDAFFDLKTKYNSVLIGITKRDKYGNRKMIKNPLGDLKITAGDYLIVILNGKAFKLLKKRFNVDEGYISNRIT